MARQFREQLEEEVQLEEARKAQRAATPPPAAPAEPVATATPNAPANGGAAEVTPGTYAHHDSGAGGTDPAAVPPAQAGGADERRT
jgi:hypothetical protein